MNKPVADRVKSIKQSDIRRFSAICAAMGGVNLSQGVCDQPAPDAVKQAAKRAIDEDRASYTNLRGIIELRTAIAKKMREFNGIACDPEKEVVVTVGSAGAFACIILATLNPGDECIVFSPFYSYHVNAMRLVGVNMRFVDLQPPDWSFDLAEVEAAVTPKTKMILLCTPANPSGKVFSEEELRAIAGVAKRHNVWIATDEIYEYITYGKPHVSIGRLPEAKDRTLTMSGGSKTYAITGWRIGYAVGPAEIIDRVSVVNDLLYICAPAPLQYGVAGGMGLPEKYYTDMRADYTVKRDMLTDTLRGIGFTPFVPEGSYYMLASFEEGRWGSATAATEAILNEVGVATVPGSAFYRNPADGENQLRFCFAKKIPDLEEACRRLRKLAGSRAGAAGRLSRVG
ncbi:MAG: pyridoxal phosphate-dependent aminotransferase [Planctomycetota bacterium]